MKYGVTKEEEIAHIRRSIASTRDWIEQLELRHNSEIAWQAGHIRYLEQRIRDLGGVIDAEGESVRAVGSAPARE